MNLSNRYHYYSSLIIIIIINCSFLLYFVGLIYFNYYYKLFWIFFFVSFVCLSLRRFFAFFLFFFFHSFVLIIIKNIRCLQRNLINYWMPTWLPQSYPSRKLSLRRFKFFKFSFLFLFKNLKIWFPFIYDNNVIGICIAGDCNLNCCPCKYGNKVDAKFLVLSSFFFFHFTKLQNNNNNNV